MSSLTTRCSACGTVFRVVPEQLRVSGGWVRCGRCSQVFDATESLVDLETGMPRRGGTAPLDTVPPAAGPGAPPWPQRPPFRSAPAADTTAVQPERESTASSAHDTRPPRAAERLSRPAFQPFAQQGPDGRPAALLAMAPSFLRQAERAARWRRPWVRAALAGTALLAAMMLAAQVAHTWRDRLAMRVPALAPLLEQGCARLGCEVGPARWLDALTVESSGLVRVESSNVYTLQVSLRNRARHPVALPALDLSLTDASGGLIARRVLQPAELGASAATIVPGRDLVLQATLQAGAAVIGPSRVITGYTVEMFYP
jgi:predicted Zn finger-like uncharacterized protein